MKNTNLILFLGLFLGISAILSSCTGTGSASKTGDEPMDISEAPSKPTTTVKEFNIDGVTVLYKPAPNQVISAQLFIKGGMSNYPIEKEGIEMLALRLATTGGTKTVAKDVFQSSLDKLGSNVTGNSSYDYGSISLRCVKRNFNESWELYKDAILNPAFTQKEFDLLKDQMINRANQAQVDPDTYLRKSSMRYTFQDQSYSKNENGTPETLEDITLDDVVKHYRSILNKSQVTMVIIGDLPENQVKALIRSVIEELPAGGYKAEDQKALSITTSSLNPIERKIKTNYMRGYMNAPAFGSDEEMAMRIAMNILRKRLWAEIRTKRSLSYAPGAFMPSGITGVTYAAVSVSTDDPNACARIIVDEIKKIKSEGFSASELLNTKGQFATFYYMRNETNASQASNLGSSEIGFEWELNERFLDRVEAVTLEKLNSVFSKHALAIQWTYLGDTSILEKSLYEEEL